MVIRFDSKAVQETVEKKTEPIGVEGDAKQSGLTEAEAIVLESKKKLDESGGGLDRVPTELIEQQQREVETDPGPELNAEALQAARKDNKPNPPDS